MGCDARTSAPDVRHGVPLAPRTTLELGGPAEAFVQARTTAELVGGLRWAQTRGLPTRVLAGGSNVVVPDGGVRGLVIGIGLRGVRETRGSGHVLVTAAAGEPWDELVEGVVGEGFTGLECLSGIPGTVGATPIQNVGAYGREVAEVIAEVEVLDRASRTLETWSPRRCGFGYRTSRFRREPGRWIVVAVTFRLSRGVAAPVRYPELVRALAGSVSPPGPEAVREAVLGLRRAKSMVIEESDPNRRSAGSFFLNPVLSTAAVEQVGLRAVSAGVVGSPDEVPRYPAGEGVYKVPAAWMIEKAGIHRGLRRGRVGVSSAHTLALVHHGGGSTAQLLALADEIRERVADRFGVDLEPEPDVWEEREPPRGRQSVP